MRNKGVPLTKNEVLLLVQLVRANKIVTDKTTNATNNRLKEEAWFTISDQFDASVSSSNRRPEQLRLKFENLKKAARKRTSNINSNQYKSSIEYIPPDEALDQVCSILGACDGCTVPCADDVSELLCSPTIAFGSPTDGSSTDNIINTSVTPKRKIVFDAASNNAARKKKTLNAVTCSQVSRNVAVAQYYDMKKSLLEANITKVLLENTKLELEIKMLKKSIN